MVTSQSLSPEALVIIKELLGTIKDKIQIGTKVMIGHAKYQMTVHKTMEANHVFNSETFSVDLSERVTSVSNRMIAFAMISFDENIGKGHTYHDQDDVLKALKLIKLKNIELTNKLRKVFEKFNSFESVEIVASHNDQKIRFRLEKTEKLYHVELESDGAKLVSPYLDGSYNIKDGEFTHLKARGLEEGLLEALDLFGPHQVNRVEAPEGYET